MRFVLLALTSAVLFACSKGEEPPVIEKKAAVAAEEPILVEQSIADVSFIDRSKEVGIEQAFMPKRIELPADATIEHPLVQDYASINTHVNMTAGLAVGDINGDGLPDVFLLGGSQGEDKLYLNEGKGFKDITSESGIVTGEASTNGATFVDITGDGLDDLLIGGVAWYFEIGPKGGKQIPATLSVWKNKGNNQFEDITESSGISFKRNMYSSAFADYDQDGDLDMVSAHWHRPFPSDTEEVHIWKNEGKGTFVDAAKEAGLLGVWPVLDWSFTPSFADLNNDGWQDLLIAGDFEQSQYFINEKGRFKNVTDTRVITDENGMGSAVGDYDNDGDLDWFVSSVYDPEPGEQRMGAGSWGISGNRLYQNDGKGSFTDVTENSGVRDGGWGWASCMADFNNDGFLDIFQVNGYLYDDHPVWLYYAEKFTKMRPRLFINNGKGQFVDWAEAAGIDIGEGRAISCTDFDRDGDVDILIQQSAKPTRFYENQMVISSDTNYLGVRLIGKNGNRHSTGARITIEVDGVSQIREIQTGGNYLSQNAAEAFFGLGKGTKVEKLTIRWPAPQAFEQVVKNIEVNQWVEIKREK